MSSQAFVLLYGVRTVTTSGGVRVGLDKARLRTIVGIVRMRSLSPDSRVRLTTRRRAILEALKETPDHPTAEEVLERVRQKVPSVSLGTVYRGLDALWRAGLIAKHEVPGGAARYDHEVAPHVHVVCSGCGAMADVPGVLPLPRGLPKEAAGFRITGANLTLEGICPGCSMVGNRKTRR